MRTVSPHSSFGSPFVYQNPDDALSDNSAKFTHIRPLKTSASSNFYASRNHLSKFIACVLNHFQNLSQQYEVQRRDLTHFHSRFIASISFNDYVKRFMACTACSDEALILALIYLNSILKSNSLEINALTIYRLFFSSVVLAAKFHDDIHHPISFLADIGGVHLNEARGMGTEFFSMMMDGNNPLLISDSEYMKFITEKTNAELHSTCGCDPDFLKQLRIEAERLSD